MSRVERQRGRYDDTGEQVTIIRTVPQIPVDHSLGRGSKDGLPNLTLDDGTQLTPHGAGKLKRLDNNRVVTVIDG
jgi:hypothetical protein